MAGTTGSSRIDLGQRGFQGSHTSRTMVVFYSLQREQTFTREAVTQRAEMVCDSADHRGENPALVAVSCQNAFGTAGGSFSVTLKPARVDPRDLRDVIFEDDWIDIVFTRHGKPYHAFRGQVDTVTKNRSVRNGATVVSFEVSGRGFGKPFEITPIWFDKYSEGDFVSFAASRLWVADERLAAGFPNDMVRSILFGFLGELRDKDRAVFELPSMPGEPADFFGDFRSRSPIISGMFEDSKFTNDPFRRSTVYPPEWNPGDPYIWTLAQEFSDPFLSELYCDLGPVTTGSRAEPLDTDGFDDFRQLAEVRTGDDIYFKPETPVNLGEAKMTVYYRDRPFPTVSRADESLNGLNGPYFTQIPLYSVPIEGVREERTARSGLERKNAVLASPKLYQEMMGAIGLDILIPLIDRFDIENHGFRRLDVATRYAYAADEGGAGHVENLRKILRDFHCLNHRYYSGTILLTPGRPDIRLGGRLRIFEPEEVKTNAGQTTQGGPKQQDNFVTYYVEGVQHNWTLPTGVQTVCTVTRGWRGSDESLVDAIRICDDTWEIPEIFSLETETQDVEDAPPATPPHLTNTDPATQGGHFPPNAPETIALFEQAATEEGLPVEWAKWPSLHTLLANESQGWVGRPNLSYGERAHLRNRARWPEVWEELRAGQLTGAVVNDRGQKSGATGLGQLTYTNTGIFMPGGTPAEKRQGIGIAINEARGMLRYIKDQPGLGDPNIALRRWLSNRDDRGRHYY